MPRNRTEPGVPEGQVRVHTGNEGSTGLLSGVVGSLSGLEIHNRVEAVRPIEASAGGLRPNWAVFDDIEDWPRSAATGTATSAIQNEPRLTLTWEDIRRAAAVLGNHQVPEPYYTLVLDRDREFAEIQRVQNSLAAGMAQTMENHAIDVLLYGARREGEDRDRREFERARRDAFASAQRQTNYQSAPVWPFTSGTRTAARTNEIFNLSITIRTYDAQDEWMHIVYELRGFDNRFRALMGSSPPSDLALFLKNMDRDNFLIQHGALVHTDLYTLRISVLDMCTANVILRPKLVVTDIKQPDLFPLELFTAVRQNPPKPVLDQDPD